MLSPAYSGFLKYLGYANEEYYRQPTNLGQDAQAYAPAVILA